MSETAISRAIQDAMRALGVPCERVQAGAHRVKRGYLRCASEGTPDLVTPLGWLEVKVPGKKPSGGQHAWHQTWANWGARVAVVTSPSEAVGVVREWMRESRERVPKT